MIRFIQCLWMLPELYNQFQALAKRMDQLEQGNHLRARYIYGLETEQTSIRSRLYKLETQQEYWNQQLKRKEQKDDRTDRDGTNQI